METSAAAAVDRVRLAGAADDSIETRRHRRREGTELVTTACAGRARTAAASGRDSTPVDPMFLSLDESRC